VGRSMCTCGTSQPWDKSEAKHCGKARRLAACRQSASPLRMVRSCLTASGLRASRCTPTSWSKRALFSSFDFVTDDSWEVRGAYTSMLHETKPILESVFGGHGARLCFDEVQHGPTNRVPSSLIPSTASQKPGSSELATLACTACCWWSFVSDRMATSSA
jgi:hypothetical protein